MYVFFFYSVNRTKKKIKKLKKQKPLITAKLKNQKK